MQQFVIDSIRYAKMVKPGDRFVVSDSATPDEIASAAAALILSGIPHDWAPFFEPPAPACIFCLRPIVSVEETGGRYELDGETPHSDSCELSRAAERIDKIREDARKRTERKEWQGCQ